MGEGKGVDTRVIMKEHQLHTIEAKRPPSPFGGAGGLSGERPPLDATDAQLDSYAEWQYQRTIDLFRAVTAVIRPRRRRRFYYYERANCTEAYASDHPSQAHLARLPK